jgi:hypothetical protein
VRWQVKTQISKFVRKGSLVCQILVRRNFSPRVPVWLKPALFKFTPGSEIFVTLCKVNLWQHKGKFWEHRRCQAVTPSARSLRAPLPQWWQRTAGDNDRGGDPVKTSNSAQEQPLTRKMHMVEVAKCCRDEAEVQFEVHVWTNSLIVNANSRRKIWEIALCPCHIHEICALFFMFSKNFTTLTRLFETISALFENVRFLIVSNLCFFFGSARPPHFVQHKHKHKMLKKKHENRKQNCKEHNDHETKAEGCHQTLRFDCQSVLSSAHFTYQYTL